MHKQRGFWKVNQTVLLSFSPLYNTSCEALEKRVHEKISLSPTLDRPFIEEGGSRGETHMVAPLDVEAEERTSDDSLKIHNNNNTQRERNFRHQLVSRLTPEEEAILNACPSEEPDRAKVRWTTP
jgi:hypothetical protein